MTNRMKSFFLKLSNNKLLNATAQRWGYRFVADQFIAGTNVQDVVQTVRTLNQAGFSCTVDHLGEFVTDRAESIKAKENILTLINFIQQEQLDCHISLKLTQLGLDISEDFCLHLMKEIVSEAATYHIFINIDTEDYAHHHATIQILHTLLETYDNVGTVVQSYFYHAEHLMDQLKDVRLRIVKGAYKESAEVAYQDKAIIDKRFLQLLKKRLRGNTFTSIATHDHYIIEEIKHFIVTEQIDKNLIQFQMLYGFRENLQQALKEEGFNFCIYLPFGEDWFGYFMRRLAERPRNIEIIIKDKLYKNDKIKKTPFILSGFILATSYWILRKQKK